MIALHSVEHTCPDASLPTSIVYSVGHRARQARNICSAVVVESMHHQRKMHRHADTWPVEPGDPDTIPNATDASTCYPRCLIPITTVCTYPWRYKRPALSAPSWCCLRANQTPGPRKILFSWSPSSGTRVCWCVGAPSPEVHRNTNTARAR